MGSTDWKSATVYMIDFEGSSGSGVVEYGVVCLRGGEVVSVETQLCRPTGLISAREVEVHGIRETEVMGRALFSDHYTKFVEFRRDGIFAAHNRHAENTFLKGTWALPPAVPDWRVGHGSAQEWGPWIDTLGIYKTVYPGLDSYSLGDLVDQFGFRDELERLVLSQCPEGRRKPHCALYDALASAMLLQKLESREELEGRMTVSWMLQLSQKIETQQELF